MCTRAQSPMVTFHGGQPFFSFLGCDCLAGFTSVGCVSGSRSLACVRRHVTVCSRYIASPWDVFNFPPGGDVDTRVIGGSSFQGVAQALLNKKRRQKHGDVGMRDERYRIWTTTVSPSSIAMSMLFLCTKNNNTYVLIFRVGPARESARASGRHLRYYPSRTTHLTVHSCVQYSSGPSRRS